MHISSQFFTAAFLLCASGQVVMAQQGFFPIPRLTDGSTGYIESVVGDSVFRGSAAVAKDERLLYSCAHVFFDRGKWADEFFFARGWHSSASPEVRDLTAPRGIRFFSEYADNSERLRGFALDFTVMYGNASFGPAKQVEQSGGELLKSSLPKRIVGYPAEIDSTGASGRFFQHSTDSFTIPATQVLGDFYEVENVSTGGGNSGGPVFVTDAGGTERLAGILVSGSESGAGFTALSLAGNDLAQEALGAKAKSQSFANRTGLSVPDNKRAYSTSSVEVSGFDGATRELKFSMDAKAQRRGDIDAFLRSPTGRTRFVAKSSKNTSKDLRLTNKNFSRYFSKSSPNGTWELKIRDVKKGKITRLKSFSVTIDAF